MGLAIVRKISTAKVVEGSVKKVLEGKPNGSKTLLYQVAGIARSFRLGDGQHGPYTEFKGDFAALMPLANGAGVDIQKGYRSPKVFFPEPFSSMLQSAISEMEESQMKAKQLAETEKRAFVASPVSVQFKVNIIAKVDEKSSVGYTYEVEPVVKPAESDALAGLIASDSQPALPPAPAMTVVKSGPVAVEHKPTPATAPKTTPAPVATGKGKGK